MRWDRGVSLKQILDAFVCIQFGFSSVIKTKSGNSLEVQVDTIKAFGNHNLSIFLVPPNLALGLLLILNTAELPKLTPTNLL